MVIRFNFICFYFLSKIPKLQGGTYDFDFFEKSVKSRPRFLKMDIYKCPKKCPAQKF